MVGGARLTSSRNRTPRPDCGRNSGGYQRDRRASASATGRPRRSRFGLVDGYSRTLEEVGRQFRVTRERIRQIEAKALRKMRHPTRIRQLEGFLEAADLQTTTTAKAAPTA